jgi:nucleoside 2-deoxyribosyltransferase
MSAATRIFITNTNHIKNADYVIANLNPFRGTEPDSGTVWEVAYAYAVGIPVIAYMKNMITVRERAYSHFYLGGNVDSGLLPDGMNVEDFGFPVNLMLQNSMKAIIEGGYKEAIEHLSSIQKKD